MLQKILKTIFKIILTCFFVFIFYVSFQDEWLQLYEKYFPCRKPIYYSLGLFDKRFGVKEQDFLVNIQKAEAIWESHSNRELFLYTDDETLSNVLKINLVYDFRQEVTTKLKALGLVVSETRASYDEIYAKYEALQNNYKENKRNYELLVASFKNRQDKYEKNVTYWNKQGGAPKATYDEFLLESQFLEKEFQRIKKIEGEINAQAANINVLVTVINNLAHTLNINVARLNNIGQVRGEEFTQGEYREGSLGEEINIYEFSNKEKLIRVLAHEFGHALGLEHVLDSKAIMYRLNENKSGKLTSDDISALEARCRI